MTDKELFDLSKDSKRLEPILKVWWETEPFGFDHPDTYYGIFVLMLSAYQLGKRDANDQTRPNP
jgi:hypothetical protein